MDKNYKNLVFTNHALERLRLRSVSRNQVWQVIASPDKKFPSNKLQQIKFTGIVNHRNIQLVAKHLPDQNKWLIVSVWVRGEDDPTPLMWKIITLPFKIAAKIATIILSYIRKYLLEKNKL
ncbi:MAG: DUF4258 domain-containing protein [Candidatus Pacebacteria bacterium]|jgi:hypothetical protein|nr:DUF4258 domain-containing protein [Candidatus Paceibacterota bacterium]MBT3511725.1 DUF4258 domain-containing protein [Candidatus Paceibacterota bacterium]MBT4005154.1 DUF4258 domain-containing protein [Candidatus Paceibacterota bacterium]MBT4358611.1 DUF4258 domain-containing protein [Candidatus Paceibacterota bacterium]MBT4680751.1 DUF4258 domain-containing protein [Candidatus Paceibacterota bacterium]